MDYFHQSVLLPEVIKYLNPRPNQNFIDGTVGGGGHALAILKKTGPQGKLIGFDKDEQAIVAAKKNLVQFKNRIILINDSYENIKSYYRAGTIKDKPDGILLDLGVSSFQLIPENPRGMSFLGNNDLDMRFGQAGQLTAGDLLNLSSVEELKRIFKENGEEPLAGLIASKIVLRRKEKKFATTGDLVTLIEQCYGSKGRLRSSRLHPATKAFQALRIAVNDELNTLARSLGILVEVLKPKGIMAVISYHSLEDRIVKHFFKGQLNPCICPKNFPACACRRKSNLEILTNKPIAPAVQEVALNPRSRSAKLRAIKKI